MSVEDFLDQCLNTLASRESWRVNQWPTGIDENVLRVLDGRGWIEFRVWERNADTQAAQPDDSWQRERFSGAQG